MEKDVLLLFFSFTALAVHTVRPLSFCLIILCRGLESSKCLRVHVRVWTHDEIQQLHKQVNRTFKLLNYSSASTVSISHSLKFNKSNTKPLSNSVSASINSWLMIRMTLDGIAKKIHAVQYILAVLQEKILFYWEQYCLAMVDCQSGNARMPLLYLWSAWGLHRSAVFYLPQVVKRVCKSALEKQPPPSPEHLLQSQMKRLVVD